MHLKELIEFFQKIVWLIGFGVTVREILRIENKKAAESRKKYLNLVFLKVNVLLMVSHNLMIIAFSKRAKEDLSDALKYFLQTLTDFLQSSEKKMSRF